MPEFISTGGDWKPAHIPTPIKQEVVAPAVQTASVTQPLIELTPPPVETIIETIPGPIEAFVEKPKRKGKPRTNL